MIWYIALGSAAGGISRYMLGGLVQQRLGSSFPVSTLIINVTGSFLLGFLLRWSVESAAVTPETRALLTTGFCGGYTTFSTYSYETAALIEDGQYARAGVYVGLSVGLALIGTFAGFALAQSALSLRERM
ncbi:MAG: fluoride efflux transporter CrcB [Gemmatimonadaceae bacterium]